MSTPAVRAASASWGWLLAGYGAAALGRAVWAVLSPAAAQEKDPGQEGNRALMKRLLKLSRPDLPFLIAAFFFLVVAVLGERGRPLCEGAGRPWQGAASLSFLLLTGETLIPHYSGRVIDILGGDFDPDAFASAIFFMCLFSVGR